MLILILGAIALIMGPIIRTEEYHYVTIKRQENL